MIQAIIFDLDDTLIKTQETKIEALQHAGKHFYDLTIDGETVRNHWGEPFHIFMKNVFQDIEDVETIIEKYTSIRNSFPTPAYEDAVDTLTQLLEDFHIGIVSSAAKKHVMSDLENLNFPYKKFTYIQGAEDTSFHKPDPKVFEPILSELSKHKIDRANTLYVGDALSDNEAATKAKLHFVGIPNRTVAYEEMKSKNISTIQQLSDLPTYVQEEFSL